MDNGDQRSEELSAFLRKALEIELEDPGKDLGEEELKQLALKCGLTEADWERLCEKLREHASRGRNFLEHGNDEEAAAELEEAVVLAPYRIDLLHDCGRAHLRLWEKTGKAKHRRRAEELFRKCLAMAPSHSGAARGIGRLKRKRKSSPYPRWAIASAAALFLLGGGGAIFLNKPTPEVARLPAPQSRETAPDIRLHRAGNLVAVSRFREKDAPFPDHVPGDIVRLAVGFGDSGHVLALRANGEIVAWGDNEFGQATPPDLEGVRQIAAGYRHGLALTKDGKVVAWGDNSNGQCDVPPDLRGVVQISAGCRHSLALLGDGSVVAWGANEKGQTSVPDGLPPVSRLAESNGDHSVVILRDGGLAAWGMNTEGQCNVPNDALGSASVVRVLAGGENYAHLDDGRVLHWGRTLRNGGFPPEMTGVENIFSGFPGAVMTRAKNGRMELFGMVRRRPGLSQELKNWEGIVFGPDFIYGVLPQRELHWSDRDRDREPSEMTSSG